MKENLSEIICIVDESGSMWPIREQTISALNEFIDSQKRVPGDAKCTIVFFNHERRCVFFRRALQDIHPFTSKDYIPTGQTALLDAIGYTADEIGSRLASELESERPSNVVVAILTDGQENASGKYKLQEIKEKILHQQEVYRWQFIYLGANQDVWQEGLKLGIDPHQTFGFESTEKGIGEALRGLSYSVASARMRKTS